MILRFDFRLLNDCNIVCRSKFNCDAEYAQQNHAVKSIETLLIQPQHCFYGPQICQVAGTSDYQLPTPHNGCRYNKTWPEGYYGAVDQIDDYFTCTGTLQIKYYNVLNKLGVDFA